MKPNDGQHKRWSVIAALLFRVDASLGTAATSVSRRRQSIQVEVYRYPCKGIRATWKRKGTRVVRNRLLSTVNIDTARVMGCEDTASARLQ